MARLWRNIVPGGKYLVVRRDGSVPEWQWFVLGSRDPAAPDALRTYADRAAQLGMDPEYVGNAQVPQVAALAWWTLSGRH
jgi:hypothetical protein